jgi:hypothetical protein
MGWGEKGLVSTPEEFVVFKHAWMIKRYERLFTRLRPKRIFELGIQLGGSCVLFQRLADAEKLVTIDISEERISAVDEYIRRNGLEDTLNPIYGVDQSDIDRLRRIVVQEFKGGELDLVIDDASHFLDETRNSFNALFPYVRPGGVYVIEDWPWAHAKMDQPDDAGALYSEREPMTKLIFEIILACPSTRSYIDEVVVDRNSVTIWRGDAAIEPEGFDVAGCCLARGRELISER